MTETPSTYIGTYVDNIAEDSTDYTRYTWSRFEGIQGPQGSQGIPGNDGKNGQTSYLHIAYSNSDDGSKDFSVGESIGRAYIGQYTDFIKDDSVDHTKYKWTLIKGEDGYTPVKGVDYFDGTNGEDGTSIVWKGTYTSVPSDAQNGWAYYNSTAKASYTYQNGSWYQMSIDGVDGQDGSDGSSIVWKGESSSAPTNPQENWVYKDTDDGKVYIYNGSGWELMVLDGSDGQDGTNGSDGLSVFITYNDSTTTPNAPTGNGTTNGWHTAATSSSIWMSQKVAASASEGTWGAPIKIKGQDGSNGVTPTVGANGNWWFGNTDTGVRAEGKDAPTVTKTTKQYYLSSSNTALVGGRWSTTPANFTKNSYMWTRDVYTMSDETTIEGDPVVDNTFTTISSWCSTNDTTLIDGAHIATGTIDAESIKADTISTLNLEVGKNVAMGSNARISWNNIDDKDGVATTDDVNKAKTDAVDSAVSAVEGKGYQTANQVTQITKSKISYHTKSHVLGHSN
jgi:hypothetical protein